MEFVDTSDLEGQMKQSSLEDHQSLLVPHSSQLIHTLIIDNPSALKELFDSHDSGLDADQLREAREYVLNHGLPDDPTIASCSLRSKAWKSFLGIPLSGLSIENYEAKASGSEFDAKIRDDTFRTFKKNADFWSKINESMLLRVLNATAADHGYVQGSAIASKCLAVIDKPLHTHIINKLRDFSVFSIRFILTLMANTQPLAEVIKLWDAIFAFGVHFGILVFCAYLSQLRVRILAEKSAYNISCIIQQGTLDGRALVELALTFVPQIPAELMDELVKHTASL
eukprot:gene27171-32825_t